MNRSYQAVIGIVVIILIIVAAFFAFHKTANKTVTSSTTSSTKTSSSSSSAAVNNSIVITKSNSSVGQYLAKPDGTPLYTYDADTSNVSNCTGSCLANWPAYTPTTSSASLPANIGTITRSDNHTQQYTYKGKPLYTFVSDTNGQVTGNGVAGFTIAKP